MKITAIGSGYWVVTVGGIEQTPRHTAEREAIEHAVNLELEDPTRDARVKHNAEYKVEQDVVVEPPPPPPPTPIIGPILFYQDFLSAPVGGYVSVFGANLGGATGVSVGGRSALIIYKTATRVDFAVPDGTTGGAIVVSAGTQASIGNLSLAVRPGRVQLVTSNVQAAVNAANLGDQLVLRGGIYSETNTRFDSWFTFADGKGGTPTDPIMIRAYPGETVVSNRAGNDRGVHLYGSPGGMALSGLKIDMQGGGTAFGYPPNAAVGYGNQMQNISVVDCELTGMVGSGGGSAALEGRGKNLRYLGNRIHHNKGDKLYHAVYIDDDGSHGTDGVEIAYNLIYAQGGGRGVQVYWTTNGIKNVRVHHNIIHDIALDGILFRGCTTGMEASYNVVYRCGVPELQADGHSGSCFRIDAPLAQALVFNNTFVDGDMDRNVDSAQVLFHNAARVEFRNNILVGRKYWGGSAGLVQSSGNVWWEGGAVPVLDPTGTLVDPMFVDRLNYDLNLKPESTIRGKGAL